MQNRHPNRKSIYLQSIRNVGIMGLEYLPHHSPRNEEISCPFEQVRIVKIDFTKPMLFLVIPIIRFAGYFDNFVYVMLG